MLFYRKLMQAAAFAMALLSLLVVSAPGVAQQITTQTAVPRQITGQVKLGDKPAPAGVPVVLQMVFTGEKDSGSQVGQTITNAEGKFAFDRLELVGQNHGRNFFAVSAIQPGFEGAIEVVDLTSETHGKANLNLRRSVEGSSGNAEKPQEPSQQGRFSSNRAAQEAFSQAQELLFRKNDPQASLEYFKKTVKLDPWFGPGYMLLGLANTQLQRWSDAQYAFEEATKVEPGNAKAYLGIGAALNEQHDYVAAQKALQHSLELNPHSAEAHFELARSLYASGNADKAAPHAQMAIELNPDYAGPHLLMGNISLQREDAESALKEFREYLRLDPDGPMAPQVKELVGKLESALAQTKPKRR